MTSYREWGVVPVVLVILCGAVSTAAAQSDAPVEETESNQTASTDDSPVTMQTVMDAWKERTERCPGGRFELSIHSRGRPVLPELMMQQGGRSLLANLPEFVEFDYFSTVAMSGSNVRYSITGERVLGIDGTPRTDDVEGAFDGEYSTLLLHPTKEREFPSGHIFDLGYAEGFLGLTYYPLIWAFNPFDDSPIRAEGQDWTWADCELEDEHKTWNGIDCRVIRCPPTRGNSQTDLWVAPTYGYSIVRLESSSNGEIRGELDCEYNQTEDGIWIPHIWTFSFPTGDEEPALTVRTEVAEQELNPDFSEESWRVEMPIGAIVQDRRPDDSVAQADGTGTLNYILLEGGKRHHLSVEDAKTPYRELLQQALTGPEPKADRGNQIQNWLILALVIANTAVLLLAAGTMYSRRTRKTT